MYETNIDMEYEVIKIVKNEPKDIDFEDADIHSINGNKGITEMAGKNASDTSEAGIGNGAIKMENLELPNLETNDGKSIEIINSRKRKRLSSTLVKILNTKQHEQAGICNGNKTSNYSSTDNLEQNHTVIAKRERIEDQDQMLNQEFNQADLRNVEMNSINHSNILYGLLHKTQNALDPTLQNAMTENQLPNPSQVLMKNGLLTDDSVHKQQSETIPVGKSPLLSSMLKKPNILSPDPMKSSVVQNSKNGTLLSSMLKKPNMLSHDEAKVSTVGNAINGTTIKTEAASSNKSLSQMLGHVGNTKSRNGTSMKIDNIVQASSSTKTQSQTAKNFTTNVQSANSIGMSESKTNQNPANGQEEVISQVINAWSKTITQQVISDFSKGVNDTLNSFVKKAILDCVKVTQPVAESGTGVAENQLPEELSRVSSLATSLLKSLADKHGIPQSESAPKVEIKKEAGLDVIEIEDSDSEDTKAQTSFCTDRKFNQKTPTVNHKPAQNDMSINTHLQLQNKNSGNHLAFNSSQSKEGKIHPVLGNQSIADQELLPLESKCDKNSSISSSIPPMTFSDIQHVQDKDGKFLIFSCNICGKRFQHHGTLIVHKRTHLLESGKSDHQCDICGKICTAARYLTIHMRTHQAGGSAKPKEKETFPCSICQKNFTTDENLQIHKRLHKGEKLYKCDICHAGFTRKPQLQIHMRIHLGIKPYKCEVCLKTFRQLNGLYTHMNVHKEDDSKPYQCHICKKGFSRKVHYVKHMRKERGERPNRCEICYKTYLDKASLDIHLKTHQNKGVVCKECGKNFTGNNHLNHHMKFHSGEIGYNCWFCEDRFETKRELSVHIAQSHNTDYADMTQNMQQGSQAGDKTRSNRGAVYKETYEMSEESDCTEDENQMKLDDDVDDNESGDENQIDDIGIEEENKYSNMIMHIREEINSSNSNSVDEFSSNGNIVMENSMNLVDENYNESSSNLHEADENFNENLNDMQNRDENYTITIKSEPIEYGTMNMHFDQDENDLVNFDPSIVKEEPQFFTEEEDIPSNENQGNPNIDRPNIKQEPI